MESDDAMMSRAGLERLGRFFSEDIWRKRLEGMPVHRAIGYQLARVGHGIVRGLLFEESLQLRAAALTYFTVLSLVPLLAFAFALLKGFGAYDMLVENSIRPYVLELLTGNEPLRSAFEKILGFVGKTGVKGLGASGLLFLVYAATRLLRNIEGALNDIWGIGLGRSPLQQVRDYAAIMVITPLCLIAGAALTTIGQVFDLLKAAGKTLGVSVLVDEGVSLLGPVSVLFLGLTFLYTVLPNAVVRIRSAALGAAAGSVLLYLVLIVHVRFQVGVANFNALYAGFAALPIFFAWQHISWLVVLVGARVAATHQHRDKAMVAVFRGEVDGSMRQAIALSAVLAVARAFRCGKPPPTVEQLSASVAVPPLLVSDVLQHMTRSQILLETHIEEDLAYVLARAPELVRVQDVVDALHRVPGSDENEPAPSVDPVASQALEALRHQVRDAEANLTLSELVARTVSEELEASARVQGGADVRPSVAAAKQDPAPT